MDITNKKILILEDDDLIRAMFTEELKNVGFDADSVGLGKEAIRAIAAKQYDLLLLDILLPDSNGLEVIKQVRQNPNYKNTKIVMLSNLGQDSVIQEAYKLGASGYLIKSAYNPDQIVSEVKKFLEDKNEASPPN